MNDRQSFSFDARLWKTKWQRDIQWGREVSLHRSIYSGADAIFGYSKSNLSYCLVESNEMLQTFYLSFLYLYGAAPVVKQDKHNRVEPKIFCHKNSMSWKGLRRLLQPEISSKVENLAVHNYQIYTGKNHHFIFRPKWLFSFRFTAALLIIWLILVFFRKDWF